MDFLLPDGTSQYLSFSNPPYSSLTFQKKRLISPQPKLPIKPQPEELMEIIRQASRKDIPLIQELSSEIWHQVYPTVISVDQINFMLDTMYSTTAIDNQIRQLGHRFIILEFEETGVGFASYSIKHPSEPKRYRLQKLYLKPELHGRGLGKKMVSHICHEILGLGGTALELNVNKKNPAILFYEHLGFYREEEVVIDIGNGFLMDDYIMVLDLTQKPL